MSNFQRRHYEGIAKLLGDCEAPDFQVQSFCEFFRQDNTSFDSFRFKKAVKDNWGRPFKFD